MTALLHSEMFRLTRRLMPRVLVLILAVTVLALYLLLWTVVRAGPRQGTSSENLAELRDSLRLGAVPDMGLGLVHQIGTVLVVILAASTIATEFGWGTIRTLLPRASGRTPFITAKLVTLALFVALIVVLGYLVAFGASALVTSLEGLDAGLGERFLPRTLASLARTGYTMLPYLALAFLVGLWGRSSAAGIGVGLAVYILEGLLTTVLTSAGGTLERIADALLSRNVSAVMQANRTGTGSTFGQSSSSDLPDPWQAAAVLAVYMAVFIALAYWRFRRRDITTE